MGKAITLVETRRGMEILETTPRYDVMFRGEVFDQLYFNTRGYVGYLPSPRVEGGVVRAVHLEIGEKGISAFRREAAALNREWAAVSDLPFVSGSPST